MVRPDSPGGEWYQPPDSWWYGEDDDTDDGLVPHPELFISRDGVFRWTAEEVMDDDE